MAEADTPVTDRLSAKQHYEKRLGQWRAILESADKRYGVISDIRLWTVIAGLGAAWFSPWCAIGPAIVFLVLIVLHVRVDQRRTFARRGIAYFERGLKRLAGEWAGRGSTGEKFMPRDHVFAADLDVFGEGSLFQLLNTARTSAGEARLAEWLLEPGEPAAVRERQEAVRELAPQVDLREAAALTGEDIHANWRLHPIDPFPAWASPACGTITACALISLAMWWTTALLAVVLFAFCALYLFRHQLAQSLSALESSTRELDLLVRLLHHLEDRPFHSPLLQRLRDGVTGSSREVAYLKRLVTISDTGRNPYLLPVTIPTLWNVHVAHALWRWQETHREHVDRWMQCLAEFEALCSLSCYAFENPNAAFPSLSGDPAFEARGLGHPLLPLEQCVGNDVSLGRDIRLLVVSGSNMSGKSTLLRAIGLNTILAWTGAPVRAASLNVARFAVGASLRTADSIQDGKSRFYAEITRLKQIADLTKGSRPVLFLLDELLSGTNSHDRRIGARGILRELTGRGGIGLVTTHDLALTEIVEGSGMANVHFEDRVDATGIHFDYRMRPGVVTKSNALELMRLAGLLADDQDSTRGTSN